MDTVWKFFMERTVVLSRELPFEKLLRNEFAGVTLTRALLKTF